MMGLIDGDGEVRGPGAPRPRAAALGACTDCGSERLTPMVRTGQTAPEALRCECCGLVLSIEEHTRLRAAVEGVPTLRVLR